MQRFSHKASLVLEKKIFKGFYIYGHGGHLGQWTATILAIFHSPAPGRLQMKFDHNWPRGKRFNHMASSILEKTIFKGFYQIWAWWPSWSTDSNHLRILSFPQHMEAPYEIWAKLAQQFQRRSFENVNGRMDAHMHGQTEGRMDDWQKVITIAHPEHSSGELKTKISKTHQMILMLFLWFFFFFWLSL